MSLPLSDPFVRTVTELFGDRGASWLEALPSHLDRCAERWSLTLQPPFDDLSYHYVAPAVSPRGEAVLKVGVPNPEMLTEIEALRLFDEEGSVRLLDADCEWGALLLGRLRPGTSLAAVPDDEATVVAAGVMRRLWRPAPPGHAFPTLAKWGRGFERLRREFDGGPGPFPAALVDQGERLFAEMETAGEPVLLHGDLHHGNVLAAERAPWLAIDPKGVVGDPASEVAPLLLNCLDRSPDLRRLLARRLDLLAEHLEIDRDRLRRWGLARAVLSAWWSYEDHGHGWEEAIACAEALTAA